jgi:UbiA prenyltransferase family
VRWSVALRLGRVSNLPTVTSDVLAGIALAGAAPGPVAIAILCVALSAFYVGGMYLNDAFDREIDRRERPERPIPAGEVGAGTVLLAGFALLGVGLGMVAALAVAGHRGVAPVASAAALAGLIVLYDLHHKGVAWSPVVMGLCRAAVYTTAALAVAPRAGGAVVVGAAALTAYLIGLTHVARQENLRAVKNLWPLALLAAPLVVRWPDDDYAAAIQVVLLVWIVRCVALLRPPHRRIRDAVVGLIAGIALVDASFAAAAGCPAMAAVCVAAFGLTLALQRLVPGT